MSLRFAPIGFVRTHAEEVPRHWNVSELEGELVIDDRYTQALANIEAGQRIVVLFNFDRSPEFTPAHLSQTPPHTGNSTGMFSTCSPVRPNPIGMSVLEVIELDEATIHVKRVDMLDGTPILDIKPFIEDKRV